MAAKKPVRRAQAISPFGVGAIVDFPGPVSLIHGGLEAWPYDAALVEHRQFRIDDEYRLARRLGVEYFILPPDYRPGGRGNSTQPAETRELRLPFLRFPRWHSCPRCGRMGLGEYHDSAAPVCSGPLARGSKRGQNHKPTPMSQMRFIAACPDGHLQDFPWVEWLFDGNAAAFDPTSMWLRLESRGSASLSGVAVAAELAKSDGAVVQVCKRNLAGAFAGDPRTDEPSALTKVYGPCSGHNPVLGIPSAARAAPGCGRHLYPLLRGATNLYIARVSSAIYIPEGLDLSAPPEIIEFIEREGVRSALIQQAVGSDSGKISSRAAKTVVRDFAPDLADAMDSVRLAEVANEILLTKIFFRPPKVPGALDQLRQIHPELPLRDLVRKILDKQHVDWAIDAGELASLIEAEEHLAGGAKAENKEESSFRYQEFKVLRADIDEGRPRRNLCVRSHPLDRYGNVVQRHFDRVSLVHKLRETRAYCGFSRFFPDDSVGISPLQWSLIASRKLPWLPAIEVRGEGLFFEFSAKALAAWEERTKGIEGRFALMNRSLQDVRARRKQPPRTVTPRFVLLHTFAHALINQLVYECGYGSSALRERIYESSGDESMAGVLVYTAAGDSEGTMGGLVSMGDPGRLENVIARAIERAQWCSSDPVCHESKGQGPGNCNLAACHACALLPETACEEQNRLLDRTTLIGTIEMPETGYFNLHCY